MSSRLDIDNLHGENVKICDANDREEQIRIRELIEILINSDRATNDSAPYPIPCLKSGELKTG